MSAIMNISSEPFAWVDWMIEEREKRGWNQADLARKAKLTRTTISDYEKRIRPNPDIRALTRISEALGYPGDVLPRVAGLLPGEPDYDQWAETTAHKLRKLSPRLRSVADRMIDGLLQEQESNEKPKPKTKSARA
jgi:transcriptional regulator with XRE-family HTH domain